AAHAKAAVNAEPAAAHLLLGEIALARGKIDAAQGEESVAQSYASSRAHALFLAARIAAARHDYAKAIDLLRASDSARRASNESLPRRFHYVAADALAHAGRVHDAEREFDAEIAIDPHDVQA